MNGRPKNDYTRRDTLLVGAGVLFFLVAVVLGGFENIVGTAASTFAGIVMITFGSLNRIGKVKFRDFSVETPMYELIAEQAGIDEPQADSTGSDMETEETNSGSALSPRARHTKIRNDNREIFLVHEISPSSHPSLPYDALIYVRASAGRDIKQVKKTEFFLGSGFKNEVFEGKSIDENRFGISVAVRGEFLCSCLVTFKDGDETLLHRYIDFGMKRFLYA